MTDKFAKRTNCLYCGAAMEAKQRNKKFCSDRCRVYWNREQKGKIEFVQPTPEAFDGKEINPITYDEPAQFQTPKQKQPKGKTEISNFWKERMKKKLGI